MLHCYRHNWDFIENLRKCYFTLKNYLLYLNNLGNLFFKFVYSNKLFQEKQTINFRFKNLFDADVKINVASCIQPRHRFNLPFVELIMNTNRDNAKIDFYLSFVCHQIACRKKQRDIRKNNNNKKRKKVPRNSFNNYLVLKCMLPRCAWDYIFSMNLISITCIS